jgi:hypothetical protein
MIKIGDFVQVVKGIDKGNIIKVTDIYNELGVNWFYCDNDNYYTDKEIEKFNWIKKRMVNN